LAAKGRARAWLARAQLDWNSYDGTLRGAAIANSAFVVRSRR
jgi:hypothetical protein